MRAQDDNVSVPISRTRDRVDSKIAPWVWNRVDRSLWLGPVFECQVQIDLAISTTPSPR